MEREKCKIDIVLDKIKFRKSEIKKSNYDGYTRIKRDGKECLYYCILNDKFDCDECKYVKHPFYTLKEFREMVSSRQKTITLIDDYVDCETRLKYSCNNCGEISTARPDQLLHSNVGCRHCRYSNGETIIEKVLQGKNIKFEREKIFRDCKYKHHLRFDFYLNEYNTIIEYDGKQHFQPVSVFGGESAFNDTVIRDKIKNKYCKNNNINIYRIPYTCKNIEKEVNDILLNVGVLNKKMNKI